MVRIYANTARKSKARKTGIKFGVRVCINTRSWNKGVVNSEWYVLSYCATGCCQRVENSCKIDMETIGYFSRMVHLLTMLRGTMAFLHQQEFKLMDGWPACTPSIPCIENFWSWVARKLGETGKTLTVENFIQSLQLYMRHGIVSIPPSLLQSCSAASSRDSRSVSIGKDHLSTTSHPCVAWIATY